MADRTCPRCGMDENQWKGNHGRGVNKNGQITVVRGMQKTAGVLATSRAVDLACTRITVSVR
jgi:hypothetical protein